MIATLPKTYYNKNHDTNWNRSGAASITSNPDLFGGEVRYPFDYGCVEMTETNGTLYIVTGHEGYVDESVGQGHQGFLMIAVDQASMTGKIVSCDLWHSFCMFWSKARVPAVPNFPDTTVPPLIKKLSSFFLMVVPVLPYGH